MYFLNGSYKSVALEYVYTKNRAELKTNKWIRNLQEFCIEFMVVHIIVMCKIVILLACLYNEWYVPFSKYFTQKIK